MVPDKYIKTRADRLAVDQGCTFDQDQADRIIRFAETYFAPQFIKGDFRLLPWQKDWLSQLYGWRRGDGRRRWRKALLSLGKKGGKTLLTSIVALYEALAAGVPSPLVVSASTTIANARQVYDEVRHTINASSKLKKLAKLSPSTKLARFPSKNAEFRSISNDSGNAEGLNLSCCICDEVHAWKGEQLYRTLEYSTIARPDGILVVISTAGHDQSHFFYDMVTKARNVIKGDDTDTSFFPTLYECPEGEEESEAGWRKANPSMGVSFTLDDFKRDLEAAKKDTASWLSFRRYRLNQWCRAEDSFIDPLEFDACKVHVTEDQLRDCPLFVGVDLSQTTDPCSVSCVWALPDRKFYVRSHAWVCEEGVRRREETNMPKYRQYQAEGNMTITPGTVNDYRLVQAHILKLRSRYKLREVVYDQFNAIEQATELMAEGMTVYRMPQNHKHFNGPVKEFEIAVREKRVMHDGNGLLRWALQNARLDMDTYGNAKISRAKSTDKVDPCISTVMAFGRAVTEHVTNQPKRSVYDGRGLCVIG